MKKIVFIFGLALFLGACSDSELETPTPKEKEVVEKKDEKKLLDNLKLKIKDNNLDWNILELVEFSQLPKDSFTIFEVLSDYDSIGWKVEGKVSGVFKVFEQESSEDGYSSHVVNSWSNNFYYPGKYKTYLVGYKNKKESYSDTITVNITNNKDFLSYNWNDVKSSRMAVEGYISVIAKKLYIGTRPEMYEGTPHIVVSTIEEEVDSQKKLLSEYMTALFDKPVCNVSKSENLQNKYYNLFKYKPKNSEPIAFWITSTSRIMLVKQYDKKQEYYEYLVYAEPYNK